MAVLVARSFQKTDRWEVPRRNRIEEVVAVVLVVGRIALLANHRDRRWPCVLKVLRRSVVLERLVVRNVIDLFRPRYGRRMGAAATRAAVRIGDAKVKAAFEEAPGHAC